MTNIIITIVVILGSHYDPSNGSNSCDTNLYYVRELRHLGVKLFFVTPSYEQL